MEIQKFGNINANLESWNDQMYNLHPTPYYGLAGIISSKRIRTILKMANTDTDDSVLEIGCESGHLLASIKRAKRVVGLDISKNALKDAAELLKEKKAYKLELLQADAQQELPFSQGEFNVIICSETLEHVEKPVLVLENINKISTSNTKVILSIPLERPKLFIKKLLRATRLFNLFFEGIEYEQSQWHIHALSKTNLKNLCRDMFKIKRCKTVWAVHYIVCLQKLYSEVS